MTVDDGFVGSSGLRPYGQVRQILATALPLVLVDVLAILVAFSLATGVGALFVGWRPDAASAMQLTALALTTLLVFPCFGLYPAVGMPPAVELRQSCLATIVTFVAMVLGNATVAVFSPQERLLFPATLLVALVAVPLFRHFARIALGRRSWWGQPVLVVGSGAQARSIFDHLASSPCRGLRPVGLVDVGAGDATTEDHPVLGSIEDFKRLAHRHHAYWAIVAMSDARREDVRSAVETCSSTVPNILVVPEIAWLPALWSRAQECGGLPGIHVQERLLMPVPRVTKRTLDLFLILSASFLVLPLLAIIAVLVKLTSRGPILYSQVRIGRGGRLFRMLKFRSMVVDAERVLQEYLDSDPALRAEWETNFKLRRDPRVTTLGRILRSTSLDELPQLWNVLRGEMSLVGPRPLPDYHLQAYGLKFCSLRHRVTPGMTGLWQISGRSEATRDDLELLDSFYIRNWSPWLDVYILACTINCVLLRRGAY